MLNTTLARSSSQGILKGCSPSTPGQHATLPAVAPSAAGHATHVVAFVAAVAELKVLAGQAMHPLSAGVVVLGVKVPGGQPRDTPATQ